MKIKIHYTLLLLSVICCAGACDSDNKSEVPTVCPSDGTRLSKSFIQSYVIPDAIRASELENRCLQVEFTGTDVNNILESDKAAFEALSAKYADVSYNDYMVPNSIIALGADYSGLKVTCDKAVDAKHPAGSSLNDLIKFGAISFKEFIAAGYEMKTPDWPKEMEKLQNGPAQGYYPLFKYLNQVTATDLILLQPDPVLYLIDFPAGTYELTITASSDKGDLTAKVMTDVKS